MTPSSRNPAWRPGKLQKRVDEVARQTADEQAVRIRWPQLLKARRLYVKWQSFLLWVRAVEDCEGRLPEWLSDSVNKRCTRFAQFLREQKATNRHNPLPVWHWVERWINEHTFSKPRREGWMDAVGYYAVRDLSALRNEAHWYYYDRRWARSKPATYPSFQEWRKASERCSDDVLDHFETTDELRELIKLSRRVSPRTLSTAVDRYVEWQVFAYWVRAALDRGGRLAGSVRRELRQRCPGFVEAKPHPDRTASTNRRNRFSQLQRWIEEREFAHARKEGWLPVLYYQAHLHPRHSRVVDYWHHLRSLRSRHPQSRYPSLEQWMAAADAYTFTP